MRAYRGRKYEEREWVARQYGAPSPVHVKRSVLLRIGIPDAVWVETGTFKGDTAAFLANQSRKVYTIEPDNTLFDQAEKRFLGDPRIQVIRGLSEEVFPSLLSTLSGTVNFWLDGHFSGGTTHQGPSDCPIREELASIEDNLGRYDEVVILIDDIRCFDPSVPEYADYPDLNFLVDWTRKNKLHWHVEHDIFVAKSGRDPAIRATGQISRMTSGVAAEKKWACY